MTDVPAPKVGSLPDPPADGAISPSDADAPGAPDVAPGPWLDELARWRAEHAGKASPHCANCGAILEGPYCHACGQPAEDMERSIGSLVGEALAHLFHTDGRLFHTLPLLCLRPAFLSREYLAGRRYSQTPPLRLFLVVVLMFFFAGSLREMAHPVAPDFWFHRDSPTASAPTLGPGGSPLTRSFAAWLNPRLTYAATRQREFGAAVESWLHRIAIAFLPISTLILSLLFLFKHRTFIYDHAICSMHSLSFMGLLFTVITLLSIAGPLRGLAGLMAWLAPTHLFFHMRGVYGASVLGTLARMLLLFVFSVAAMAFLLLGVVGLELNGMGR